VVPSPRESLSLLTLEAFAVSTPVVGNAASAVVRGHLRRSGAGVAYPDEAGFIEAVRQVEEARPAMSRAASAHAERYGWARVVEAYREEMDALVRAR